MWQELIHLYKRTDLANLKSHVHKLDIVKFKKIPTNLNDLETKVDKSDVDKLIAVPVDLSKLTDIVKNDIVKNDLYNAKIKKMKTEYLIILT